MSLLLRESPFEPTGFLARDEGTEKGFAVELPNGYPVSHERIYTELLTRIQTVLRKTMKPSVVTIRRPLLYNAHVLVDSRFSRARISK